MFKNFVFTFCFSVALLSTGYVFADDAASNKFGIVASSDGKVFMINKDTGATWLYTRMSDVKQGWVGLDFFSSDGKTNNTVSATGTAEVKK